MFSTPKVVDIPEIFHSVEHDGLFTRCMICTSHLLESETPYAIEKIFRGTETILEMAICMECSFNTSQELSMESLQTIETEFNQKVDWAQRMEWLTEYEDESQIDSERWLEHCILDGTPRKGLFNFQIAGAFIGDKMLVFKLPYMISGVATARISEKLSKQTQDQLRGFIETNFGMPPELCDPPVPALF